VTGILASQRHLFDIPDDVAFLNCAYMSPLARAVQEAGIEALTRKSHPWTVTVRDFFDPVEEAREAFARRVSGDVAGVAIVPSVSYGVSVAAANLPVGSGRTVVVVSEQFPSNVYPWRAAVQRDGGEIVTVRHPGSGPWTQGILDAIDERTAVVAVPMVHWTDGRAVDLVAVGEAVRDAGAALVVDATQSLGAVEFDVETLRPDFVVAAAYKWLMGPYSVGFMWVAEQHRSGTPIEYNWITRDGSEDFAALVDYRDVFESGARRYDMGERSNFALIPMAGAGLRMVHEWGPGAVEATVARFTGRIETAALRAGLDPVLAAHRRGHLIGVRVPGGVPPGLQERLRTAGVFVSVRSDAIRVSPHVYNTDVDVDRFLDVLAAI
jgi:selenocysteine lyase/cysteine desulfurase